MLQIDSLPSVIPQAPNNALERDQNPGACKDKVGPLNW